MDFDSEYQEPETLTNNGTLSSQVQRHETLDDAPHVITDSEMKTFMNCADVVSGSVKGFTKAFMDDEGMLIDLTDKAGRKRTEDILLGVEARIDQKLAKDEAVAEEMKQTAEKPVIAELKPEDRDVIVKNNKHHENDRYWTFGSCFIGALMFIAGMLFISEAQSRIGKMNEWYNKQSDMIGFGYYISDGLPRTFRNWEHETQEFRDSVMQVHSLESWEK